MNKQRLRDSYDDLVAARAACAAKEKAYSELQLSLCPEATPGSGHELQRILVREWNGPYRESFYITKCSLCCYSTD